MIYVSHDVELCGVERFRIECMHTARSSFDIGDILCAGHVAGVFALARIPRIHVLCHDPRLGILAAESKSW